MIKKNIKVYKFFGIAIWIIMFILLILHNFCPHECRILIDILGGIGILFFLIIQVIAIKDKLYL